MYDMDVLTCSMQGRQGVSCLQREPDILTCSPHEASPVRMCMHAEAVHHAQSEHRESPLAMCTYGTP